MTLLLAALLAAAPVVTDERAAPLLPADQEQVSQRASFSIGELSFAPPVGLFAELLGAAIVVGGMQWLLLGANAGSTALNQPLIVIPVAILSTAILGGASAVGIQGFLKRPDIDLPVRAMWICGSGSMAVATVVGLLIGALTGAPVLGALYGLAVGAVGAPFIQTFVATRSAKVRFTPSASPSPL